MNMNIGIIEKKYTFSHRNPIAGWWFGTIEFYDFPFSWECHPPN